MNGNYKMLPIASKALKCLAWAGLVLGIISSGMIFAGLDGSETPRWMGLVALISAVVLLLDMSARIR